MTFYNPRFRTRVNDDDGFRRMNAECIRKALAGDPYELSMAFNWSAAPQGCEYWRDRASGFVPLSEADRDFLRSRAEWLEDGAP